MQILEEIKALNRRCFTFSLPGSVYHMLRISLYSLKKIRITPSPSPYPHPSIMKAVSEIYTAVNSIQSERKYHTSLTSHNFITLSSLLLNFIRQSSKCSRPDFQNRYALPRVMNISNFWCEGGGVTWIHPFILKLRQIVRFFFMAGC